ncbi:MAG: TIGR00341 family protein, partial [Butyricimonas virosa]
LRERLNSYLLYDTIGHQVIPEVKILYPSVKSLAISRVIRKQVDSLRADTLHVAIVAFGQQLSDSEEEQFSAWLAARIGVKNLKLIKE